MPSDWGCSTSFLYSFAYMSASGASSGLRRLVLSNVPADDRGDRIEPIELVSNLVFHNPQFACREFAPQFLVRNILNIFDAN